MRQVAERKIFEKVISGGQTGADQGALDAALELGHPCGGGVPRGEGLRLGLSLISTLSQNINPPVTKTEQRPMSWIQVEP